MKIFVLYDGKRVLAKLPHPEADHVRIEGEPCPKCSAKPWGAVGAGRRPSKDDRAWEADGHCTECKAHIGIIRVETNTLFGVREDQAVLQGRCRVY